MHYKRGNRTGEPALVGHSFHFTCRCSAGRAQDKCGEGMKVIKVEDQKRRMADAKPCSSLNTSNKCRLYVENCILLCFWDTDTSDFSKNKSSTLICLPIGDLYRFDLFLGDSFQYALGNLSIFLSVLLLGSGKGTRRTKIWLRKMILIRRRSAGTEAGIGELFTSSELCQWWLGETVSQFFIE